VPTHTSCPPTIRRATAFCRARDGISQDLPEVASSLHSGSDNVSTHSRNPALSAGILLGIGLGGFVDGIVLHQIAQWHNMFSAVIPPDTMAAMRENMRADGYFHAGVWIATFAGTLLLWKAAQRGGPLPGTKWFLGLLILGWGIFNLVEGVIDHHILELHHVRDLPQHVPIYDYAFLGVGGILMILIGWTLTRPANPLSTSGRTAA
jgi:uncharacterized membrane protein